MWVTGQMTYHPNNDLSIVSDDYGIDFEGPVGMQDGNVINVPEIPSLQSIEQVEDLTADVDILGNSESVGLDKYITVLEKIKNIIDS